MTRQGSTKTSQEVLYNLVILTKNGDTQEQYGTITIPKGTLSVTILSQQLQVGEKGVLKSGVLSVIPNGNDYAVGDKRSVNF